MWLTFIIYFGSFAAVPASVVFEDCGSAYDLHTVNIAGCSRKLPCYVTLGEDTPVTVQFHAEFVSRQLNQDVNININLINTRARVTPEPCQTVDCPVRTDRETSFTSVMSVPNNMASNQRGYLNWHVLNENGQTVLCYSVLVQTETPVQRFIRQALEKSRFQEQVDQ